ncbi:unannotated protein [freshwater metagenome]|jgi:anthranilate phosphoribosyltransferase|uniref:anthranilate phosphoribosyltransferase n=1 Tax=freshwater metagenome TaxID=449393 RepID=A0A6J6LRM7_9ZZZZ|nr:anthranilate phosphoribosyltransferase [Actinomycetota bacterium]MSV86887.1 anthranilate phosphoribosyltransferase [Actinomycetota bacterium]MSW68361.1 anthranilate phosphoribosyltransferase [Actinomycetota bacterium]MSX28651.1 anthranilate phosphoribosyltransferase [Actinomycetota bacterium]MSY03943.1 anthranilate phosphoribosyltransferase [Actinomycetota bacterium]
MAKTPIWPEILLLLWAKVDLTLEQSQWAMREILDGNAEIENVKAFLLALKEKGESAQEVESFVAQMIAHCSPILITERAVDTVGTGGDGAHTINISTTAAIIAAAAGARVVKHGNRAASSKSGSADLLEALGIAITLDGDGVARCVEEIGIGFCFAPIFHPAMRFAGPARKELGVPTIFNILGPLANPAQPKAMAVGVANAGVHQLMAQVLADRGVEGFVFRGDDGLDEITLGTTTTVLTISGGKFSKNSLDPLDFAIDRAPVSALVGGDAKENAEITKAIFAGERGAPRDAVVLNAAAAIAAYEGLTNLSLNERIEAGIEKAIQAIDSGKATTLLNQWVALSQQISAS